MKSTRLLFILGLGIVAGRPVLAQDQPAWIGAADCRLAPVRPAPADAPSWSGGCKDGYADGKGVLEWRDKNGKVFRLEASYAAGQVRGPGKLTTPSGTVYTGTIRSGMPDGQGYFQYADGSQYEGQVRMGRPEGIGELLYANGDDYKGQWKNGKPDGKGKETYALGGSYDGDWKDGRWSGQGKLAYAGPQGREVATVDGRDPNRQQVARPDKTYAVKEDEAEVGTSLKHDVAVNVPVPPNLGYDKLSPEQQALVNNMYPALAPGDEPPYPLHGPAEFFKTVARVAGNLREQGAIQVYVSVGKDGKAQGVRAVGLDDPEARKLIATAAVITQYKPARCAGQPCEMTYPYRLTLAHTMN